MRTRISLKYYCNILQHRIWSVYTQEIHTHTLESMRIKVLQRVAACCSVAVRCSVLQRVAACCSVAVCCTRDTHAYT